MRKLSLRLRILLITTSLVAGVVAVILGLVSRIADETAKQVTASARDRTSLLLHRTLNEESSHLGTLAELMAQQPGTKSVLQADFPTISDYLNSLTEQSGAGWVMMYDDQGRLLGASKQSPPSSAQVPESARVALSGTTWKGIEQQVNGYDMRAATPIRQGAYLRGTIVVGRNIDKPFLDAIGEIAGVQLELGSRVKTQPDTIQWTTDLEQGNGAEPLTLAASISSDSIIGPFRALRTGLAWLLGAALLSAFLLAISISVSVTRPLNALVDAASELGRGQWPAPFQSQRGDEIGLLQNTFDQMTRDLQQNYERLASMLHVDPLTELLNHRAFRERLELEVRQAHQIGSPLGLILINLDAFDDYNRRNGADRADELLKQLAAFLRTECPDTAVLGRHGGDEFAICILEENPQALAELLRQEIESGLGITATLGCASISEQVASHDLLILAAQMATQQAKVAGRNRVRYLVDLPRVDSVDDLRALLSEGSYPAVRALAEAVDAKDEYTRGHSQRVADYAKALAEYCGYDPGFVELVYVTGTLHDVGKIGVPDAVLKKPGKLTDEEFELIKLHPTLGEKIVSQLPHLAEALPGVRSHHERYDGRGYPDGLAGEEIPLIARILAIADTFDAMTSDRPYRKGLDVSFTLDEMERSAGSQFDPALAEQFIEMMRKQAITDISSFSPDQAAA